VRQELNTRTGLERPLWKKKRQGKTTEPAAGNLPETVCFL